MDLLNRGLVWLIGRTRCASLASPAGQRDAPVHQRGVMQAQGHFTKGVPMSSRSRSLRRQAYDLQNGRCCYSGVAMSLSMPPSCGEPRFERSALERLRCTTGHLVPRSEGGADHSDNIAVACGDCNGTPHRRKCPPTPPVFQVDVRRRVARVSWHHRWVHDHGPLAKDDDLKSPNPISASRYPKAS